MSKKNPPMHFHEFGRMLLAWRLSSDGQWAIDGEVIRFRLGMISDGNHKALQLIFFPIIISIGFITPDTGEGK